MTPTQRLLQVRLPLAAPVIMAGVRTAAVITVGAATLAAFIGAGGLGEPIVTGLALADTRMVLSGALPAARSRCSSTARSRWSSGAWRRRIFAAERTLTRTARLIPWWSRSSASVHEGRTTDATDSGVPSAR